MINRNKFNVKLIEKGYTQRKLVAELRKRGVKMSENTLSSKLNGKTPFNTDEAPVICEILEINDPKEKTDIFFNHNVPK